jgi:hypothetical protein
MFFSRTWKIDPKTNIHTKTSVIIHKLRCRTCCNRELLYGTQGKREGKENNTIFFSSVPCAFGVTAKKPCPDLRPGLCFLLAPGHFERIIIKIGGESLSHLPGFKLHLKNCKYHGMYSEALQSPQGTLVLRRRADLGL